MQRRLAGVYELANDWPRALGARAEAAESFARTGQPGEAATELLATATHLWDAGDLTGALQLVKEAWARVDAASPDERAATASGPVALRVRATALEGVIRASLGEATAGVELTGRALDLSLAFDLDGLTAEVYYLHSIALEQATDYQASLDAMSEAITICRSRGFDDEGHICLACLTPALRHTGQWDRALDVGQEVLASDDAPEVALMVATGEIGLIMANRGEVTQARRHLARSAAFSRVHELFPLEVETSWGLARSTTWTATLTAPLHGCGSSASAGALARSSELLRGCAALGVLVLRTPRAARRPRPMHGRPRPHCRRDRYRRGHRSARPCPRGERHGGGRCPSRCGPIRAGP